MSDRAKWFRMLHAQPHLSNEQAAKFCAPDPARDLCLVYEGQGTLAGEVLGGARLAREADSDVAEFSVSLRPEAQGLGLARESLACVLALAPRLGCRTVFGIVARENAAMLTLARRLGFQCRIDPDDPSLIRAEIDVGSQPANT